MSKSEKLDFYLGTAMWIGLSDGELAQAEKVMIHKRLKRIFSDLDNLEEELNRYEKLFREDYQKSLSNLKERMKDSIEANLHKTSLVDFATKIIIDDQVIQDQEEFTIGEIKKFFESLSIK